MFRHDLVAEGKPYAPEPWDVARELWYWKGPEAEVDIPTPRDCIIYRKFGRINKSNHHCLEINPRDAHNNLRDTVYSAYQAF